MDAKHKDMQHLGIIKIFKETFKIINKNRKIFAMAALCFIHPLNYILFSFMGTLNLPLRNFLKHGNFSHLSSHNSPFFWSSNALNIIFLFGYSIVSTAAIAHTVAALYTGREPSPNDTARVLRKVWKRVLVTFLCVLSAFLVYNIISGFVLWVIWTTILPLAEVMGSVLGVFFFFYFEGLLYLVAVFQLSGVVSVLEDSCGFKAMAKSRLLLKGKMAAAAATAVVFVVGLSFGIIMWLEFVVSEMLLWPRMIPLIYALVNLLLLLLVLVFLLWKLVLETMLYVICKSSLNESIDISALSDQDYIPLSTPES